MDAPLCRNFPSCGKRHYGNCTTKQTPRTKQAKVAQKPPKPKPGDVVYVESLRKAASLRTVDDLPISSEPSVFPVQDNDATYEARLEDRVFNLERTTSRLMALIEELLTGKRKRAEYMKEYQRQRRSKP